MDRRLGALRATLPLPIAPQDMPCGGPGPCGKARPDAGSAGSSHQLEEPGALRRVGPVDWASVIVSVVVGVTTGVASSFAVWWFLTRRLRPRVTICPTLAVFRSLTRDIVMTQFRIRNDGRRPAHDVSVSVSVRMSGLIRTGTAEWAPVRTWHVPVLLPDVALRWAVPLHRSELLVNAYLRRLPLSLRRTYQETGRVPADELLRAVDGSSLRVSVFATDSYSKSREYFEQSFTSSDLRLGRFVSKSCDHDGSFDRAEAPPATEVAAPESGLQDGSEVVDSPCDQED